MKYISKENIYALSGIVILFYALGNNAPKFISEIKPLVNLPELAFAGFIAFAIVGVIMAIGRSFGIWFGKKGGAILYTVTLFIINFLLF
jgi:hypothetical protein